ncbi:MAG TPA: Ig-like domain-containing protein [Gemmatimonadaceae bacterium]|nr:Ig-like domain-containing protein [Gemmatimonadaceae bacterium]
MMAASVARLAAAIVLFAVPAVARSQAAPPTVTRLEIRPDSLSLRAGDTASIRVTAYDARGNVVSDPSVRIVGSRRALAVSRTGQVRAIEPGRHEIIATSFASEAGTAVTASIPVIVARPSLTRLEIVPAPGRLYAGVTLAHSAKGYDRGDSERHGLTATWQSSDPAVASVDWFGFVTAHRPGQVTITAQAEARMARTAYTIVANPVARIEIGIGETDIRTGDAVHLVATARGANGRPVPDAPLTWTYSYTPDDTTRAPGGPGIIDGGLFAANAPGLFEIIVHSGGVSARKTLSVAPRDVRRRLNIVGRGVITDQHTSDLWPWTGRNGRDYVLVGTWGADGYALVFDITDLNNPVKTDSVKVDARTINDVTVSPDGRYGALSREGASNRVNGVVILDLADPAHPKIASTFDEQLTGGVHNMFATNDHLFAVSGGAKYVIIDVKDIYNPKYVSEYAHPFARLHDLWVRDGIAYSAQGGVGTVIVDVGNGAYGGTIENPKLINVFPINSGHEIFPYEQKATGKRYLFIGDEEMNRRGRVWEGTNYSLRGPDGNPPRGQIAQTSGGYTHIVDATDFANMRKVGRYHLEDFGSHDIIVEDDILYQAYYEGGVRLVDVSGELLGNLADQGREIAVFKPFDPDAYTANAPFVMNAMPWKGHVLFTDFNSGLWVGKLEPRPVIP